MPKISDAKSKSKSKRKPLKDVSNAGFRPSSCNLTVKKSYLHAQQQDPVTTCRGGGGGRGPDSLDRLILVHSDLSFLIHQIDELVVQVMEQKVVNKKEIESFAHVLYEMQTSLKPWVTRFRKVLPIRSTGSENQLEVSLACKKTDPSITEDSNKALDSPDIYELDSLVSPSPLVSWRADCTAEGGKQLFLLTPLPKPEAFSSRLKEASRSVFEKITSDVTVEPMTQNLNHGVEVKHIASTLQDPVATNTKSTVESGFLSPEKVSKVNVSLVVSTPCLKMSPPKSCILLEPISEYSHKNNNGTQKPTPYLAGGGGSGDSESASSQPSGHLAWKYPELFGIKPANKLGNARKVVEESPNWRMSPPKTCILLEPTDDKALSNAIIKDVESNLPKINAIPKTRNQVIESTPMFKDLDTTIQRGRRPGENTLKKELWTRFEAATTHGVRFKASVAQETGGASNNKGFMDLLEEVSCDDTGSIV